MRRDARPQECSEQFGKRSTSREPIPHWIEDNLAVRKRTVSTLSRSTFDVWHFASSSDSGDSRAAERVLLPTRKFIDCRKTDTFLKFKIRISRPSKRPKLGLKGKGYLKVFRDVRFRPEMSVNTADLSPRHARRLRERKLAYQTLGKPSSGSIWAHSCRAAHRRNALWPTKGATGKSQQVNIK